MPIAGLSQSNRYTRVHGSLPDATLIRLKEAAGADGKLEASWLCFTRRIKNRNYRMTIELQKSNVYRAVRLHFRAD